MPVNGLENVSNDAHERDYLSSCDTIMGYLDGSTIKSATRLPSKWRSDNTVIKLETDKGNYVFKYIADVSQFGEIGKIQILHEHYDNFLPKVHAYDHDRAFLMDFIDGKTLNSTLKSTKLEDLPKLMEKVGQGLTTILASYKGPIHQNCDGFPQLAYTLGEYGTRRGVLKKNPETGGMNLTKPEWGHICNAMPKWIKTLEGYPGQTIHNDLNTENILLTATGIRAIDPGFGPDEKDIAKDIARTSMTCFYETLINENATPRDAANVLEALLTNFKSPIESMDTLLPRIAFYVAQTHLSFSQFRSPEICAEAKRSIAIDMFKSGKQPRTVPEFAQYQADLLEDAIMIYGRVNEKK